MRCNGRPALRVGDPGIHMACCGPNTWNAKLGSTTVFINGKCAYRMTDTSQHCGGMGQLIEGSPNVIVGGPMGTASGPGGGGAGPGGGGAGPGGGGTGPGSGGGAGPGGGGNNNNTFGAAAVTVVDEGGLPVGDASVQLTGPTAASGTTAFTGLARLENLQPGAYQVTGKKEGYDDGVADVPIAAGDNAVSLTVTTLLDWGLFGFDVQVADAADVPPQEQAPRDDAAAASDSADPADEGDLE